MKAISILSNVESWRKCVGECRNNADCVTASYSNELRVCHLQSESTYSTCDVTPYRRFRKTTANCFPDPSWVTYKRANVSREHELDPCFPDATFQHPELVNVTGLVPTCPLRKLDGSQGPPVHLRFLSCDGSYNSLGTDTTTTYNSAGNYWNVAMPTESGTVDTCVISVMCAELGGECTCSGSLPPSPIAGAPSVANVRCGACPPGMRLLLADGWRPVGEVSTGEAYGLIGAACNA